MTDMDETGVVTCFLRNRGEVLLLRRSGDVGSYAGKWGAVAGHAEGAPDEKAREEIAEETGLDDAVDPVRAGDPFTVTDEDLGTRWRVHPYLFDCDSRDVETNWETTAAEWVSPTAILRRETVPDLWTSYRRVRPGIEEVAGDTTHGSAYVSLRALEVLRDRAGEYAAGVESGDWDDLAALARDLLDARPSMTVVRNRVNRVMSEADRREVRKSRHGFRTHRKRGAFPREASEGERGASQPASSAERTPEAVERAAVEAIERACGADATAAGNAADELPETVLTLSRSGTVFAALKEANPRVFVAESRPAREGVDVAEELAREGRDVTVHVDAATAHVLATEDVGAVVVGADTVLPDGRVVNKVGTRGTAVAAAREGVPVYVVAARDKVRPDGEYDLEPGGPGEVYDGDEPLDVINPTFDVTPADAVSGLVTEEGMLDADEIEGVAAEMAELAGWQGQT